MNAEKMTDSGADLLRIAICKQAVYDYEKACNGIKRLEAKKKKGKFPKAEREKLESQLLSYKRLKKDAMQFFKTEWFENLAGVNEGVADKAIRELQRRHDE